MIAYASRTGTRRNIETLRRYGWRIFLAPSDPKLPAGFRYALDNGAWRAHQTGQAWDEPRFLSLLEHYGQNADWIVLPDIVCGGLRSLDFSLAWRERIRGLGRPFLLAVQNGMTPGDVRPLLGRELGIFVGGDTLWKLKTLPEWGDLAELAGCHLHVGRVNTRRRIRKCAMAGVDSFDGSSVSRYAVNAAKLDAESRQLAFRIA